MWTVAGSCLFSELVLNRIASFGEEVAVWPSFLFIVVVVVATRGGYGLIQDDVVVARP